MGWEIGYFSLLIHRTCFCLRCFWNCWPKDSKIADKGCLNFFIEFDEMNVDSSDYALLLPLAQRWRTSNAQGVHRFISRNPYSAAKNMWSQSKTLLGDSLSAFAKDRPTQQHDTWGAGLKRLRFDRFSIITREETFLSSSPCWRLLKPFQKRTLMTTWGEPLSETAERYVAKTTLEAREAGRQCHTWSEHCIWSIWTLADRGGS